MGVVVVDMDWSPIIAGGITGLLSGAVSGNLIQYVLDKRRMKHDNRYKLLIEWDKVLSNFELTYNRILQYPSYELLKSFLSPKSQSFINTLETETENKMKRINSKIDDFYEVHEDEILSIEGTKGYDEQLALIDAGVSDLRDELFVVEQEAKQALVACLKRELLLRKKKWGMF